MSLPWLRIVAEGAVIVLSILLALTADAWWAEIEARRAAHEELATVLDEFRETRAQIEQAAGWHRRMHSGEMALAARLQAAAPDSWIAVPDTSVAQLVFLVVSEPPTASLEAFLSAGRLERVESAELREELLAWTSVVADLRDGELLAREHMVEAMLPYLREEFDVARPIALVLPMYRGALNLDELRETRLRSTATLRALVAWQVGLYELLVLQSGSAIAQLDRLIVLLQQELS